MAREQVWVLGLYGKRATEDQPKRVLFFLFQVKARDAGNFTKHNLSSTLLQELQFESDCWAAYNRIIALDRRYNHQTVNPIR
jgi:hypothetical protein